MIARLARLDDAAYLKRRRAERAGKAQTVTGLVDPATLGATLMHEHLLIDASHLEPVPDDSEGHALCCAPLTPEIASRIKFGGQANLDNARLDDLATSVAELIPFREAGGGTVVEVTNVGLHRNPAGLRRIAETTGLRIVMGSSYYVGASHPDDMGARSEDSICAEIVEDVFEGVAGSGICSGIIGEAGCSWPLTAGERKVLRASARAQRVTGAPLSVHPGRHEDAPQQIVDILADAGADLRRTIICHLERTIFSRPAMKRLAATGCILEFDLFGHENSYYWPAPHLAMPNDSQRLDWLEWLIGQGHGGQIVVSHDNDNKIFQARHGGPGYAHILTNIVPRMHVRGFAEETIRAMLVDTPRRVLAFV